MRISLIVAMDKNRLIGSAGKLPWHLPAELAYFKNVTMGHPLVMGRKTHEAIGKALPGRRNIVLTRNTGFYAEGCEIAHSVEAVSNKIHEEENEAFVIGGEEVFSLFLHRAARLYITLIDHEFEGDRFFPEVNLEKWRLIREEHKEKGDANPYSFTCYIYEK